MESKGFTIICNDCRTSININSYEDFYSMQNGSMDIFLSTIDDYQLGEIKCNKCKNKMDENDTKSIELSGIVTHVEEHDNDEWSVVLDNNIKINKLLHITPIRVGERYVVITDKSDVIYLDNK